MSDFDQWFSAQSVDAHTAKSIALAAWNACKLASEQRHTFIC